MAVIDWVKKCVYYSYFSLLFGYSACDFSYISVSISMLFLCVTTGRIDSVFTTVEFGVSE